MTQCDRKRHLAKYDQATQNQKWINPTKIRKKATKSDDVWSEKTKATWTKPN